MMLAKSSPAPLSAVVRVVLRPTVRATLLVSLLVLAVTAGCGSGTGVSGSPTTIQPGGPVLTATPGGSGTSTAPAVGASSTAGSASSSAGGTSNTGASSSSTSSPQPAGAQQAGADWPAYDHDAARSGVSSDQAALGSVRRVWTSAGFDGAIYAQPLIVGNRVLAASEGDTVYALDVATGVVAWQRNLGQPVPASELPCGDIDPSGITGTPVVDPGTATLFVVGNLRSGPHHELFALDLSTGAVRWHRPIDPPGLAAAVEQQRGALALSGGRVYVPFGGLYGDCGQYKGAVVSVAADGSGGLTSYVVPTSRMAGIWNPEGAAIDAGGDLWVTTGNSAAQSVFDFGNAVIRLTPGLTLVDYFAPTDWARLNAGDIDLGSLGPVLLPNSRAFAVGKDGIAYLVDAGNLGHVGHPLASLDIGSSAFGAAVTTGSRVFIPTTAALVALDVGGDKLSIAWKLDGGSGPPIMAARAVWALGYDGMLRAADPATGTVRFSAQLSGPVSRFISPAAAGGRLFVPDGNSLAAFTLR